MPRLLSLKSRERGGVLGLLLDLGAGRVGLAGERGEEVGEEDVGEAPPKGDAVLLRPDRGARRQVLDVGDQLGEAEVTRPEIGETDAVEATEVGDYGGPLMPDQTGDPDQFPAPRAS